MKILKIGFLLIVLFAPCSQPFTSARWESCHKMCVERLPSLIKRDAPSYCSCMIRVTALTTSPPLLCPLSLSPPLPSTQLDSVFECNGYESTDVSSHDPMPTVATNCTKKMRLLFSTIRWHYIACNTNLYSSRGIAVIYHASYWLPPQYQIHHHFYVLPRHMNQLPDTRLSFIRWQ